MNSFLFSTLYSTSSLFPETVLVLESVCSGLWPCLTQHYLLKTAIKGCEIGKHNVRDEQCVTNGCHALTPDSAQKSCTEFRLVTLIEKK